MHAPWQLIFPGQAAGDVVRALAWLDPEKTTAAIHKLKSELSSSDLSRVASTRARLPTWMAKEISALLPAHEEIISIQPGHDFGSRKNLNVSRQASNGFRFNIQSRTKFPISFQCVIRRCNSSQLFDFLISIRCMALRSAFQNSDHSGHAISYL